MVKIQQKKIASIYNLDSIFCLRNRSIAPN